jgi:hypothetical protein
VREWCALQVGLSSARSSCWTPAQSVSAGKPCVRCARGARQPVVDARCQWRGCRRGADIDEREVTASRPVARFTARPHVDSGMSDAAMSQPMCQPNVGSRTALALGRSRTACVSALARACGRH